MVKEGRLLDYFTPLSFSTDPEVAKEFFGSKGLRTLIMIEKGFGYNLQPLSAHPKEAEVLTESVTRVRIKKVEKFDGSEMSKIILVRKRRESTSGRSKA